MKNVILAKLIDANGNVLQPPNPAAILIENGVLTANYDLNEIFSLALTRIKQQRESFEKSLLNESRPTSTP